MGYENFVFCNSLLYLADCQKLGRNQMTVTVYRKSERDHGHRNFKKEPLKLCQNLTL